MLQLLLLLLAPLLIVVRADLSVIFHETGFSFSYNFAEQVDEVRKVWSVLFGDHANNCVSFAERRRQRDHLRARGEL